MIDFFAIFTRGGMVLWYFQATNKLMTAPINNLVKSVILQERGSDGLFKDDSLALQYKLDNEFELVFVVAYQHILSLTYVDKLLTEAQREFRDRFKNQLTATRQFVMLTSMAFASFTELFHALLHRVETEDRARAAPSWSKPKSWTESAKSQKTVASMIQTTGKNDADADNGTKGGAKKGKKKKAAAKGNKKAAEAALDDFLDDEDEASDALNGSKTANDSDNQAPPANESSLKSAADEHVSSGDECLSDSGSKVNGGEMDADVIARNRQRMAQRFAPKAGAKGAKKPDAAPAETDANANSKKKKQNRVWELGGKSSDQAVLDFSDKSAGGTNGASDKTFDRIDAEAREMGKLSGKMAGELRNLDDADEDFSDEPEEIVEEAPKQSKNTAGGSMKKTNANVNAATTGAPQGKGGFGKMFSALRGLIGTKRIELSDLDEPMARVRELLISKNVAADVAARLCDSVAQSLVGRQLTTFQTLNSTIRAALHDSCVALLTPKRQIDILRECHDARARRTPYRIVFCGVNGVGKSTNLAKIAFWLTDNGFRVLIAACDTFRAGAVEQLRTHVRKLNAIYGAAVAAGEKQDDNEQERVRLFERGYGKDASGICAEAVTFANAHRFDVVLVDTAGRMQDNEPLMRALAKLIHTNQPDLVLFVGEALVGNDGVDQLTKFNQALADFSAHIDHPHLIDAIVLTKFDTVDDKVGAAISMTFTTGQPILFVGTGQTYTDLYKLNAKAVVNALVK